MSFHRLHLASSHQQHVTAPERPLAVEMATALYYPFKAVGYVTDGNPFFLNRLGDETFLTVSIGKSFQVR